MCAVHCAMTLLSESCLPRAAAHLNTHAVLALELFLTEHRCLVQLPVGL